MEASLSSVEICPSATFVPFVAMSLGLAGEALAGRREISAPVHVDSSFAAFDYPTRGVRVWQNKKMLEWFVIQSKIPESAFLLICKT